MKQAKDSIGSKIVTLEEAKEIRKKLNAENKRVIFANGIFDILHGGHVSYLADAKALGDVLFLGVNSDESERRLKGEGRPICKEAERLEILNAIRFVDWIVLFNELTCENLLRNLVPDVHVKGTDYTVATIPEREVAHSLGIEVAVCGPPKENASRGIIATVAEKFCDAK